MTFTKPSMKSSYVSMTKGILLGMLCSMVISLLLLLGVTSLLLGGKIEDDLVGLLISVIKFTAVMIGVLVCTSITKEKFLIQSVVIAIGYVLLLTITGLLIYDGVVSGFWMDMISVALGAAAGYLLRFKLQDKGRRRRKIR